MESAESATLDLIRIGPSTFLCRIVAVKVFTCRIFLRLIASFRENIACRFNSFQWRIRSFLRGFFALVNPRNPNVILGLILLAAFTLRRYRLQSVKAEIEFRQKFWSDLMASAPTYDEWAHAAGMLEKYRPRKKDSDLYDEELVRAKLQELLQRRMKGSVEDIAFALRTDLLRNLGNMCNSELHKGRLQTPKLIQSYISEVRFHLKAVCDSEVDDFPLDEKLAFIHETRHAFGRTALLLSGGAALGAFHLGVVRTLIEHRLLPCVVAGASVGSIICSFAATRTWSELQAFFDDPMPPMAFFDSMGSIFATAQRLLTRGAIAEIGMLQRKMRQLIGDLTFQEAYDLSGRVLGIPVCSLRKHEPPRLLNYLTSPHVVIWSAVTASCAFPGLFEAQELMAKDRSGNLVPYHIPTQVGPDQPAIIGKREWRDGSLESDLPMRELKELFNVNHFIVAQANPHIAPLLRIKEVFRTYGGYWAAKMAQLAEMEVKHRCNQALEVGWRLFGLAKLFAQDWEGDITIVMPATIAQFIRIIQNPTPSELRKAVMQGRRCTWAKLSAIQANCGIELMLDQCVSELNHRRKVMMNNHSTHGGYSVMGGGGGTGWGQSVGGEGSRNGRLPGTKRIPSWNCLARESTWGCMDEDGMQDNAAVAVLNNFSLSAHGGPWSGQLYSSSRRLRLADTKRRLNNESSDSDSGAESSVDPGMVLEAWRRVGGPLLRVPSGQRLARSWGSSGDSDDSKPWPMLQGSGHEPLTPKFISGLSDFSTGSTKERYESSRNQFSLAITQSEGLEGERGPNSQRIGQQKQQSDIIDEGLRDAAERLLQAQSAKAPALGEGSHRSSSTYGGVASEAQGVGPYSQGKGDEGASDDEPRRGGHRANCRANSNLQEGEGAEGMRGLLDLAGLDQGLLGRQPCNCSVGWKTQHSRQSSILAVKKMLGGEISLQPTELNQQDQGKQQHHAVHGKCLLSRSADSLMLTSVAKVVDGDQEGAPAVVAAMAWSIGGQHEQAEGGSSCLQSSTAFGSFVSRAGSESDVHIPLESRGTHDVHGASSSIALQDLPTESTTSS
eukprot:TRINITY_DN2598_c0_g1_i5.p1 TRINITY_DN2598_c0_g1~~TRINITY_DN2598_c0_g1_i5.p1  ORF type:complete len:1063 (-),score=242.22 TRINITY_DN2598_c0_g1_i5:254-3442(-)